MGRFLRLLGMVQLGLACVFVLALTAGANGGGDGSGGGSGSRIWVNDFEHPGDDTPAHDWYNGSATINRAPSGYVSPTAYGSGIPSAHGRWHARIRTAACGVRPIDCDGPYTHWGKPTSVNPVWPSRGYVTELDIYLDVQWAASHDDYRFDWISANNNKTGGFNRDWVFNVGTQPTSLETPGFYINASTNSTRGSSFPENPCPSPANPPYNSCRAPIKVTQSGWYTFRHRFYSYHDSTTNVDYLAVDFTIARHNAIVKTWTIISAPFDPIALMGGDRYGWFSNQEINDLAVDCSTIHPPMFGHPALYSPCQFGHSDQGDDDDHHGRHTRDDDDHGSSHHEGDQSGKDRYESGHAADHRSSSGQVTCANGAIVANSLGSSVDSTNGTAVPQGADVVVPAGASCVLAQSSLGNVTCNACLNVDMTGNTLAGDLVIANSLLGGFLFDNEIGGDFDFVGNSTLLDMEGNNVSGDAYIARNALVDPPVIAENLFRTGLVVSGNTAPSFDIGANRVRQGFELSNNTGVASITLNAIGGDVTCAGNLLAPTGSSNTAASKNGQCALL